MDAAKPSVGGPTEDCQRFRHGRTKPAEGAAAAKRPDQMFVVQKSGPVPAGAAPGQSTQAQPAQAPDAAAKNAFQSAITQGAAAARPGTAWSAAGRCAIGRRRPTWRRHASQSTGRSAAGQPAGVPRRLRSRQEFSRRGRRPARRFLRRWPKPVCRELAEVEIRPDALLSCLVILTRLFGNPKSLAALASGLPIGEAGMTPGPVRARGGECRPVGQQGAPRPRRRQVDQPAGRPAAQGPPGGGDAVAGQERQGRHRHHRQSRRHRDRCRSSEIWRRSIPAPCWWCGRRSASTAAPRK